MECQSQSQLARYLSSFWGKTKQKTGIP